jgi:uncharacterized membrane protein (TIGR02234 family)
MSAKRAAAAGMRLKILAAALTAAGGGMILLSDSRPWAEGTITSPIQISVSAPGSSLTSLPYALGLTGLAGAVALFAVRRFGRHFVGVALLAAGVGTVVAVVQKISSIDTATLARSANQAMGVDGYQITGASATAWPFITIAGGVFIAAGAVVILARGRIWTGLSSRYERDPDAQPAAASPVPGTPTTNRELWDALNRGTDPTL